MPDERLNQNWGNHLKAATNAAGDIVGVLRPQSDSVRSGITISLAQSAIPMVVPPGDGSANGLLFGASTDGSFTSNIALSTMSYPQDCFLYFPANGIPGITHNAGMYYTIMSSATAGKVYNNTYTSGKPQDAIPASPTAFSDVTNGAYLSQTMNTALTLADITLPGGMMGPNGVCRIDWLWGCKSSANAKILATVFGATTLSNGNQTTSIGSRSSHLVRNRTVAKQVYTTGSPGTADGTSTNANPVATNNTAADLSIKFTATLAASVGNLDWIILDSMLITVIPG